MANSWLRETRGDIMRIQQYLVCIAAGASMLSFTTSARAQNFYMGQIIAVGFNYCPTGTMEANGQILPISPNQAMFSLFGTTYGGDGRSTFALPDLRGRRAIGQGQGPGLQQYIQGQVGGRETVALTVGQMPAHSHSGRVRASSQSANTDNPANAALADFPTSRPAYRAANPDTNMRGGTVQTDPVGGGQPVSIVDPYLTIRYCVVTIGIYPPHP